MSAYARFLTEFAPEDDECKSDNSCQKPSETENQGDLAPSVTSVIGIATVNEFSERAAISEFDGQVPSEWSEGFARLQCMERPASIPENRWLQVIDDAGRFLDSWGAKLAAFGWSAPEVFGVHPSRPEVRRGGLVWHLRGCKVLAACEDRVIVESKSGNKQSIYSRVNEDCCLFWQLETTEC